MGANVCGRTPGLLTLWCVVTARGGKHARRDAFFGWIRQAHPAWASARPRRLSDWLARPPFLALLINLSPFGQSASALCQRALQLLSQLQLQSTCARPRDALCASLAAPRSADECAQPTRLWRRPTQRRAGEAELRRGFITSQLVSVRRAASRMMGRRRQWTSRRVAVDRGG